MTVATIKTPDEPCWICGCTERHPKNFACVKCTRRKAVEMVEFRRQQHKGFTPEKLVTKRESEAMIGVDYQ